MKAKKIFYALTSCTAILLCSVFACACVGVATTTQSTKQIAETQEEIKETIEQQETQEVAKEESQQPTIVNNYIDNSVTNIDNSVTNIDNSVTNIDNSTTSIEKTKSEPVVVEQPSATVNSKTNDEGITIPVGDERLDTNPNPYIVHIKHLQCPKCGTYEYLEHYNKQDTNLVHYIGSCSACNYEY